MSETSTRPPEVDHSAEVERLIEPRTTYSVGRVQRDILRGSSNVGAIATGVVRDGVPDGLPVRQHPRRRALRGPHGRLKPS